MAETVLKRWVLITGLEMVQLGIPSRSLRGPFHINMDARYVDKRCLWRYQRRLHNAIWRR